MYICMCIIMYNVRAVYLLRMREIIGGTAYRRRRSLGAAMVYCEYTKRRILFHQEKGLGVSDIVSVLKNEGIKSGVWHFLKNYSITKSISRKPGSGRRSIVTSEIKRIVDQQMEKDDETTACQLVKIIESNGFSLSLSTVLRCRRQLGWTWRGSAYCQLIRSGNKIKRLEWARQYLHEAENGFQDVIYTDETSIQQESHRRHSCRREGQPPRPKPR